MGFVQLEGLARVLLVVATVLYLLGVQLPTFRGNVPLNNRLQTLELITLSEPELAPFYLILSPSTKRVPPSDYGVIWAKPTRRFGKRTKRPCILRCRGLIIDSPSIGWFW